MTGPNEQADDVDRLYTRLEQVEPPADFVVRVMARAQRSEAARWPRWQQVLFGVLYVAALVALAVLAYLTGGELESSHARELIALAIHDISLVSDSPGVYLAALRDAIPWPYVLAVLADIVVLALATRLLLGAARPARDALGGRAIY